MSVATQCFLDKSVSAIMIEKFIKSTLNRKTLTYDDTIIVDDTQRLFLFEYIDGVDTDEFPHGYNNTITLQYNSVKDVKLIKDITSYFGGYFIDNDCSCNDFGFFIKKDTQPIETISEAIIKIKSKM